MDNETMKRLFHVESINAPEQYFSTYCPDLEKYISSLNMLDENVNKAVREGMHNGADIILNEQKRLASNYPRLVKHITKGKLNVSRNGNLSIDCGYSGKAFETIEDNTNMGIYGAAVEFGRPGTGKRSKKKMKQIRHGKEIDVNKGSIQPHSHIIRGFENKQDVAVNAVIDSVNKALDGFGGG